MFGDTKLPARFWSKVSLDPSGCWLWTGATGGAKKKYGTLMWDGKVRMAHRLVYCALVEPIDISPGRRAGDHIHHECGNGLCVNPEHLVRARPIDHIGQWHRDKTHCPHGHAYDERNTYVRTADGARQCRTCARERATRNRIKRRVI